METCQRVLPRLERRQCRRLKCLSMLAHLLRRLTANEGASSRFLPKLVCKFFITVVKESSMPSILGPFSLEDLSLTVHQGIIHACKVACYT